MGNATLYQADCRDLLARLDLEAEAVITDPPYGVGLRNGDVDGHRSNHWDSIAGDSDSTLGQSVLEWALSVPTRTVAAFASPWAPWSGKWRNLIAWNKGGAVGGGGDIRTCLKRSWELLQVRNPNPIYEGGRAESVWHFPMVPSDTSLHICAKPEGLMARILTTFVSQHEVVCDPFMGSGSTGVACMDLGRRFIGVEIESKYFDIACRRIDQAQKQQRLFA